MRARLSSCLALTRFVIRARAFGAVAINAGGTLIGTLSPSPRALVPAVWPKGLAKPATDSRVGLSRLPAIR
jgi:hypothetical protein